MDNLDNTKKTIKKDYLKIIKLWGEGEKYYDLYHMIVYFIKGCKYYLDSKDDMNHIYNRMTGTDDIKDIVNDFIYGDIYLKLRKEILSF